MHGEKDIVYRQNETFDNDSKRIYRLEIAESVFKQLDIYITSHRLTFG